MKAREQLIDYSASEMNDIENAAFEYLIGHNVNISSKQAVDIAEKSRDLLSDSKFAKKAIERACDVYRAFIKKTQSRYWRYNLWDPVWEDSYVERLLVQGHDHADTAKRIFDICGGFEGKKILEAGCGFGKTASEMARRGGNVTGIDINGDVLNIAKMVAVSLGLSPRDDISFQHGALESIPYPSDHFDIIWSENTIEHVDNIRQSINELYRVLKPGGLIIIRCPNYLGISREPHFKTYWPPYLPRAAYRWLLTRDYRKRAVRFSREINGEDPDRLLELAKSDIFLYSNSLHFVKSYQISAIVNRLKNVDWNYIRSSFQPARLAWKTPIKYVWYKLRLDIHLAGSISFVITKNANLEEQLKTPPIDLWS